MSRSGLVCGRGLWSTLELQNELIAYQKEFPYVFSVSMHAVTPRLITLAAVCQRNGRPYPSRPWVSQRPSDSSQSQMLMKLLDSFFAYRIYNFLSKYRLLVTIPIVVLALLRVGFALTTAHLMLKDRSLAVFKDHHEWIFSLGLGLSSGVDILITITMMAILHGSRSSSLSLDTVIRSLILYTLENSALTTAATIVSMICWLVMDNLIFLALHFIIAKRTYI
ncbi:hypothetical protein E1B28_008064 [Marasmius oreades]|uniref:DUF6534 domain-containing protein n=1 Tax=Marasmius oreades TaxID=181124 RepID=A0A9P7S4R8_9AGAR|nr:uncharacterized protein E1B28_008064 [Marasmius oreades]KAG7094468.1 hypothetical protein E1B28_008064 [Marasmius oreades]